MAREIPGVPGQRRDEGTRRLEALERAVAKLSRARVLAGNYVNLHGQTGSIATTAILTNADEGWYAVSVYLECTTAGVGGTLTCAIHYTDNVGSISIQPTSALSLGSTGRQPSTTNHESTVSFIHLSGNISYSTTKTGGSGSPQYTLHIALEKLAQGA